ncbi:hypothetical protein IU486_09030 [Streptomyces gardneri]|nr:hypothetical protein [Streptomyces gardneri]
MREQNDVTIAATAAAATASGLTVRVGVRGYMATQHLWAARRAARESSEIEQRLVGTHKPSIELEAVTTNAVLLSVAFMEATVNEILQDIAESEPGKLNARCAGISEDAAALLRELWTHPARLERAGTLEKYQVALVAARKPRLAMGDKPYQWASKLISLRNALVHFKPEWQMDDNEHAQEKNLKGVFSDSTLYTSPVQPWYPRVCLASGCAVWAHSTAVRFVDIWWHLLGLERDYHEDLRLMPAP